jgi:branched-chain amino acid transport system substrate-binding protein
MPIHRRQLLGTLTALATGTGPASAQTQRPLVVHIGPFTGQQATEARELNEGLTAGLKAAPEDARRPQTPALLTIDDRGDPEEFLRALNRPDVRSALCVVAPQGAAVVDTLLRSAWMDRNEVLVINPVPGADAFRQPGHQRLLHIRASDGMQISKVIQHAHTIGQTSLTMVTQQDNSPAGDQAWEAARATTGSTAGMKLHRVHVPNTAEGLARLRTELPPDTQAVLAVGAPDFMALVLGMTRKLKREAGRYALSYLSPRTAAALVGDDAQGIVVAQVFPGGRSSARPLMARFNAAMQTRPAPGVKPTVNQLEGFLIAQVVLEGLRRSRGALPAELLAALRSRPVELGGFAVDFSRGNSGSRFVEMGIIGTGGDMVN